MSIQSPWSLFTNTFPAQITPLDISKKKPLSLGHGCTIENGLFIFRRDLRIVDNNGLNFLSTLCNNIYTIFIFTPEQVGSGNKYKSDNAVQFMIESLENLSSEIRKQGGHLHTFYGSNNSVIEDCVLVSDDKK